MQSNQEAFPVDSTISVINGETIYKNSNWWLAVILANTFGHNKILIYQWRFDKTSNKWKRKQKLSINFSKDWEKMKPIIERYIKEANI